MSLRQERINKALVQQISEIIRRMKDPRLGFVTVTQARITPDLHLARVGVSVFAEADERLATIRILDKAAGWIRCELGKGARLKSVPVIEFFLDESAIDILRVNELLKSIENDQAQQ